MPAQWQGFPLRTQQEMLAGRDTLARKAVEDNNGVLPDFWKWADAGEVYLRERFKDTDLAFSTTVVDGKIKLSVLRTQVILQHFQPLFDVLEDPRYFVSELTVTKIIMVL